MVARSTLGFIAGVGNLIRAEFLFTVNGARGVIRTRVIKGC